MSRRYRYPPTKREDDSHQASKRTYVLVKLLKMLSRSVYIYCHFISKNGAIRLKIEDGIDVYRDNLQITIIDPHKNLLYKIDILFPSSIRCTPATESTNCVLNSDLLIFQLHEQCKWNISHMFGLNIFCVWYWWVLYSLKLKITKQGNSIFLYQRSL